MRPFSYIRKYHSMTVVMDPTLCNGRELTRLLWATPTKELIRKKKAYETGFYCFGGIDEHGSQTDDLLWLCPDYKANGKLISKKTGDYQPVGRPEVKFVVKKIKPEGRGPIARSQHSATFFKGKLVIFGGRNKDVFPIIKNVALNDLHILDIEANCWIAIAMYGDIPGSRWGHRLVSNDQKIMLFGGMNLSSYYESVVYDIHISKYSPLAPNFFHLYLGDNAVHDFLMKPVGLKPE